jgi:hypothetical protein
MKKQINEIKRMQLIAGILKESQLNEEQYAEPIVMIQNIVDNWADGGIDAEPAMTRIDKILQGNYEDESGEGFINENETADELFQMFKDEDLLNDRREYDVEDLMSAYPGLSKEEAKKLKNKLQNV